MYSHIIDIKHIEQNVHPVVLVMPKGWQVALGCCCGQTFEITDGAPSTARSRLHLQCYFASAL